MQCWGIIGGTGLQQLDGLEQVRQVPVTTPFGSPSAPIIWGELAGQAVAFLSRHGVDHTLPPHQINYRANIWALRDVGVTAIVGVAAVGGIAAEMGPSVLTVPDQLIDYTYGRAQTFFDTDLDAVTHIDFTYPYSHHVRDALLQAAREANVSVVDGGCYGVTQGPRLETAQEIVRMEQDGCSIVGMTGMPEAALARELGLDYASLSVVANEAAGKGPGLISMAQIEANLTTGMERAKAVLLALLTAHKANT